jgi:TonB family protein
MTRRLLVVVVFLVATGITTVAARQDSVSAARDLYTTASYEEALAMLDRLTSEKPSASDARTIEQFRAFALFALGRTSEAEKAIEAVVTMDPAWELADSEAPPRIVGLFNAVRERALPSIIRERFAAAKAVYNEKKYEEAVESFSSLILLLEHPAVTKIASSDLADLKTVASGFRDLAKAAADQAKPSAEQVAKTAAPSPSRPVSAAAPGGGTSAETPPPANATGKAPAAATKAVTADPVLPPTIITQQIPRPMGMAVPISGESIIVLDVLVDELGRVERATVRQSVNRAYEAQLLAAARGWRYTPATQAGKPVKYVKTLEITLTPR